MNNTERPIVPDIGILASKDPVALDHASFDLVNQEVGFAHSVLKSGPIKGEDKFRGVHEKIDSLYQLQYAASIGLGSMDYELIEVRIEKKTSSKITFDYSCFTVSSKGNCFFISFNGLRRDRLVP